MKPFVGLIRNNLIIGGVAWTKG